MSAARLFRLMIGCLKWRIVSRNVCVEGSQGMVVEGQAASSAGSPISRRAQLYQLSLLEVTKMVVTILQIVVLGYHHLELLPFLVAYACTRSWAAWIYPHARKQRYYTQSLVLHMARVIGLGYHFSKKGMHFDPYGNVLYASMFERLLCKRISNDHFR